MENLNSAPEFSVAALWVMLEPIVETQPKFIGGSEKSILLVDFSDFKGECLEHETNVPFFEIFNRQAVGAYEHRLDGKRLYSNSYSSGISYYANRVGYSVRSSRTVNCYLLGINPHLFYQVARTYNFEEKAIGSYKLNLNDPYITMAIDRVIRYIQLQQSLGASAENQFLIDCQASLLVDTLFNPLLGRDRGKREDSYQSAIERVIEWLDSIIENWEELALEKLLKVADVENPCDFLRVFERKMGKEILKYYRERKIELIRRKRTKKIAKMPSTETIEKILKLLHEKIDIIEQGYGEEKENRSLLSQISKKIGVQVGSLKNTCTSMKLQPYRYYRQQCLEYAKYLLLTTDYTVLDIAKKTGYTSDGLRLAIKKDCECTPREFRNLFQ